MLPDALSASALGRTAAETRVLRQRIETTTAQVGTGRTGEFYGDLGVEARRSLDLRAELGRAATHVDNIERSLGRAGVLQEALGRLHAIASDFAAEALRLQTLPPEAATNAALAARAALEEVAGLLNTRQDGEYLFAGADSANPPVVPADDVFGSPMVQAIRAAVAALAPGNGAAVVAATVTAAEDATPGDNPFARFVATPPAAVAESFRRGTISADGVQVGWGPFAGEGSARVAVGELVRGLAIIASLTGAENAQGADFTELMQNARQALADAGRGLASEQAALGAAEQRLSAARESALDRSVLLRRQVAAIEEVDVAETVTKLQALRARLEASYRAVSMLSELSLTRFLR
ncbi:MAG: flagellin [Acetobacteraceae bacterium]